jgi:hypothetical protein
MSTANNTSPAASMFPLQDMPGRWMLNSLVAYWIAGDPYTLFSAQTFWSTSYEILWNWTGRMLTPQRQFC